MYSLLWLISLSTASPVGTEAPEIDWNKKVDFAEMEVEASVLLSQYLQVDTTNPPGNESEGADFLASVLTSDGIESKIVSFAPNRGSLIAKLSGSGEEGALCLVSHIDVVTAEPKAWKNPPFSGRITDDAIWGRGAIDMKGTGAIQLQILRTLHRLNVPLRRDIVLLALADEEVENGGVQHVLDQHWEDIQCTHAINEGGLGVKNLLFPGQDVFAISVGEKGVLWLQLTAKGRPGHGSTPRPEQSTDILLAALQRIRSHQEAFSPPDAFYQLLDQAGRQKGGITGWILRQPRLVRMLLKKRIREQPLANAGTSNTINLTGLEGRVAPNVIPSQASAILDIRILPGTTTQEMLHRIESIVDDKRIQLEILSAKEARVSPLHDPVFTALKNASEAALPGAVAGPVISVGFTDSVYLRQKGVHAYGLAPFMMSEEELLGMHGHNERLSMENLALGLRIYWNAILALSLDSSPSAPR